MDPAILMSLPYLLPLQEQVRTTGDYLVSLQEPCNADQIVADHRLSSRFQAGIRLWVYLVLVQYSDHALAVSQNNLWVSGINIRYLFIFIPTSGLLSSRSLLNMLRHSEKEITFCITLKYLCNRLLRYSLQEFSLFSPRGTKEISCHGVISRAASKLSYLTRPFLNI